jgi:hypothetical protein
MSEIGDRNSSLVSYFLMKRRFARTDDMPRQGAYPVKAKKAEKRAK